MMAICSKLTDACQGMWHSRYFNETKDKSLGQISYKDMH